MPQEGAEFTPANFQQKVLELIRLARYAEAERAVARFAGDRPGDSLPRYLAFRLAYSSGNGEAGVRLRQLLALPADEFSLYRQFSALMISGDYRAAFARAEELAALDWEHIGVSDLTYPFGDDTHLGGGKRAWVSRTLRALDKCAPALKRTPWHPFYRSVLLHYVSKEEALDALRKAARPRGARYGWMAYHSGRVQLSFGRPAEAVKLFTAALKARPRDWVVRCARAESLASLKKFAAAHADLGKALRLAPDAAANIKTWQGEILLWQGRYREALALTDGILEAAPAFVHTWRAIACHKLGDRAGALAGLAKALAFNPGDSEALAYRAEMARLEKDFPLAQRYAAEALKAGPDNFWAYANLALVRLAQGKERAFLENYHEAGLRLRGQAAELPEYEEDARKAARELGRWFARSKGNRRWTPCSAGSWLPGPGTGRR